MEMILAAWLRYVSARVDYTAATIEYAAATKEYERFLRNHPPPKRESARKARLFLVKS